AVRAPPGGAERSARREARRSPARWPRRCGCACGDRLRLRSLGPLSVVVAEGRTAGGHALVGASLPSSYWVTPAFLDWRRATERNPVSPGRQRSIGSARRRAEAMPDGRRQSRRVRGGRVTPTAQYLAAGGGSQSERRVFGG